MFPQEVHLQGFGTCSVTVSWDTSFSGQFCRPLISRLIGTKQTFQKQQNIRFEESKFCGNTSLDCWNRGAK